MLELILGEYYDEYQSALELWHKEMDNIYSDDDIIDDDECTAKMLDFFEKNASKGLYEFIKNTKPIENPPGMIID